MRSRYLAREVATVRWRRLTPRRFWRSAAFRRTIGFKGSEERRCVVAGSAGLLKESTFMNARQSAKTGGAMVLILLVVTTSASLHADEAEDTAAEALWDLGVLTFRDGKAQNRPIVGVYLHL